MLAWVWRSRLTWRASFVVTAALCAAGLGSAGIGGEPGAVLTAGILAGWLFLIARLADNEALHAAEIAAAKGRILPRRRLRRLLCPLWARAVLLLAALAATLVAAWQLEGVGLVTLTFVVALGAACLIERLVTGLRAA